MFRVDENIDPNIMSKTASIDYNEASTIPHDKQEKVGDVLVNRINKKRPFELTNSVSPLRERRLTVHPTSPMRPLSFSSSPKKFAQPEHDIKMIEAALGGTEQFHVERFEKEYEESLQKIIGAVQQELTALRHSNKFIGFGGLKQAGLKKWKLLVKLDISGKINELVVGKFRRAGGFTKAYFTPNGKVILVPKKKKSESGMQALQAYSIITSLRNACSANEQHIQQIMPLLPPLPEKHMVEGYMVKERKVNKRPIMVVPRAISAVIKIINPPKDLKDVIDRLRIIRDVAKSLAFCHEKGLVHGDIKPDNLLITKNGIGQLHDFGGSCIFNGNEGNDDALAKYRSIDWTPFYNHYQDYLADQHLSAENANVDKYIQLGRSRDVFTLGVTTIISLLGILDKDKKRIYPFVPTSYYTCEQLKTRLPNGNFNSCQDITCLQLMPNQVSEKLKNLLKLSLEENYTNRITAAAFAEQLDHILTELNTTNSC